MSMKKHTHLAHAMGKGSPMMNDPAKKLPMPPMPQQMPGAPLGGNAGAVTPPMGTPAGVGGSDQVV